MIKKRIFFLSIVLTLCQLTFAGKLRASESRANSLELPPPIVLPKPQKIWLPSPEENQNQEKEKKEQQKELTVFQRIPFPTTNQQMRRICKKQLELEAFEKRYPQHMLLTRDAKKEHTRMEQSLLKDLRHIKFTKFLCSPDQLNMKVLHKKGAMALKFVGCMQALQGHINFNYPDHSSEIPKHYQHITQLPLKIIEQYCQKAYPVAPLKIQSPSKFDNSFNYQCQKLSIKLQQHRIATAMEYDFKRMANTCILNGTII